MKYLFTLLITCSILSIEAQVAPKSEAEEKRVNEEEKAVEELQLESENFSLTNNYNLFNSRKQNLLNTGAKSSILNADNELNGYLNNVANINANSHEFNMMQYWLNGKNLNAEKYLLDAYRMDPNNEESFDEVLEYANWKNDKSLELEVAEKIKNSNKYEKAIYSYSADLLNSLPNGSVLITSGEIETITGRIIQLVDGKSKKITVIRKEWLENNRYSVARLKELDLEFNNTYGDLKPAIQNLIESNSDKQFYLSLTLPKSDFSYMLDRLYLTGLAYKYSSTDDKNLMEIESNWERIYLKKNLDKNGLGYFGKKLMSNYLLSGIKLHQYYTAQNEKNKAKKLKEKLLSMAEISGHKDKIEFLL